MQQLYRVIVLETYTTNPHHVHSSDSADHVRHGVEGEREWEDHQRGQHCGECVLVGWVGQVGASLEVLG